MVGSDTYAWGIKDFPKCWSESLAKRRLCLGPAGVINCTPLSALSFWVSLFPGMRGYNTMANALIVVRVQSVVSNCLRPRGLYPMHGWMDGGWMVGWWMDGQLDKQNGVHAHSGV